MPETSVLLTMLNEALKTEHSLIQMLQSQSRVFADRPEFGERLEQHLRTTEDHAERVKGCIERLGSSPSATMQTLGTLSGTIRAVGLDLMPNQMVKMVVADYAAENMEIALYEAITVAAEEVGDDETARVAREILRDEEAMASWLRSRLPEVSRMQVSGVPETA